MVAPNTSNKLISDESYTLLAMGSEIHTETETENHVTSISSLTSLTSITNHLPLTHTYSHTNTITRIANNGMNLMDSLDVNDLHSYVTERCHIDHNQYVWLGNERKFGLGFVRQWCQRRSIRTNLQLVCNGLKPVKGSDRRFTINEILDNSDTHWTRLTSLSSLSSLTPSTQSQTSTPFTGFTGLDCVDTEVNYVNRVVCGYSGEYPISETAKVIATSMHSKLFIVSLPYNQNEDIIGIRAKDGFVLIHSKLSVYSLPNYGKNAQIKRNNDSEIKSCYSHLENGHLFILGEGGHLLLIDKRNSVQSSRQCILLVGMSGFDFFSINDRKNNSGTRDSSGEHSSHKLCADSPLTTTNSFLNSKRTLNNDSTRTSGRQVHLHNGDNYNINSNKSCLKNEQKMTEINAKRCTDGNMIGEHIKKQKCDYSSIDCYVKQT